MLRFLRFAPRASFSSLQSFSTAAAAAKSSPSVKNVKPEDIPQLLKGGSVSREEYNVQAHSASLYHLRTKPQKLPSYPSTPSPAPLAPRPKNKNERWEAAHQRRMEQRKERKLFPLPLRSVLAPIKVPHTPIPLHQAAVAGTLPSKVASLIELAAKSPSLAQSPSAVAASAGLVLSSGENANAAKLAADAVISAQTVNSAVVNATGAADAAAAAASAANARFAVIDVNGKQHKVVEGDLLMVDHLPGIVPNDKLLFDRVLLVGAKSYTVIGRPLIPAASVYVTCEEQASTRDVIVFKKRRRKSYRRTRGFRAKVTLLRIDRIDYEVDKDTSAIVSEPPQMTLADQLRAAGVRRVKAYNKPVLPVALRAPRPAAKSTSKSAAAAKPDSAQTIKKSEKKESKK